MKHGPVLMVVHHHPTDGAFDSGPRLWGNHRTGARRRRGVKGARRGR